MFLVVPSVLAFAWLLNAAMLSGAGRGVGYGAALVLCAVLTGDYLYNTFQRIERTGGESHRTFRTGTLEPKEGALAAIRKAATPGRAVVILTEDWWIDMPIRYLAARDSHISVQTPGERQALGADPRAELFVVGFADGEFERSNPGRPPIAVLVDPMNRPILKVWKPTATQ
jgi:hypothetical protein